jgi:hypothetical protein
MTLDQGRVAVMVGSSHGGMHGHGHFDHGQFRNRFLRNQFLFGGGWGWGVGFMALRQLRGQQHHCCSFPASNAPDGNGLGRPCAL